MVGGTHTCTHLSVEGGGARTAIRHSQIHPCPFKCGAGGKWNLGALWVWAEGTGMQDEASVLGWPRVAAGGQGEYVRGARVFYVDGH